MGRKSTKENKNIYQTSREDMNYSREAAAEAPAAEAPAAEAAPAE